MKVLNKSKWLTTGVLLYAILGARYGLAQGENEPELDYYQIEIIVFRHTSGPDPAYRWPGQPDIRQADDLFAGISESASMQNLLHTDQPHQAVFGDAASNLDVLQDSSAPGPALVEVAELPSVRPVDPGELALSDSWRRLERNRGYQPLVHLGWRQPAAPFSDAVPIRIHGGKTVVEAVASSPLSPFSIQTSDALATHQVEELDGSIAFERSRFLHLHIDLALHVPLGEYSDSERVSSPMLDYPEMPVVDETFRTYRLIERRQIKTGSINYFDHRRFGVITLVEKWTPPIVEPPGEPATTGEDGTPGAIRPGS